MLLKHCRLDLPHDRGAIPRQCDQIDQPQAGALVPLADVENAIGVRQPAPLGSFRQKGPGQIADRPAPPITKYMDLSGRNGWD